MKRIATAALTLGLALTIGVREARAQSITFGAGGGITIPTGDFKTAAKLGWHGLGLLGYGMPGGLGIRADFMYGQNTFKGSVSGKAKLAGGLGSVTYSFPSPGGIKPYLIGGVGLFNVKGSASAGGISASASETKVAFGGGAGLKFKAGMDSNFFVEGRYISVRTSGGSTGFIPITAGITFGI